MDVQHSPTGRIQAALKRSRGLRVSVFSSFSTFTMMALFNACDQGAALHGVAATNLPIESTVTSITAGTVEAEQQTELAFGTSGRISQVKAQVGQRVKQGDLLASLEGADLQTILSHAEKEYERAKRLFEARLSSRVALDDARQKYDVAKQSLTRAQIHAPFDGLVTEVNLEVGEMAQSKSTNGKPLIRLIDLKPRIVKGEIDEIDLAKVRSGAQARIKILAARGAPFTASVSQVVPFVSTTREQDRTSKIELRFAEDDHQIPVGASADIEIVAEHRDNALAVPTKAILGHGNQRYVYRAENGRVVRAPVKTGIGNYERTEILEGLSSGDVVVMPSDTIELKHGLRAKVELQNWP